jgi:1,4-dihydroxy-6-naphthoate synthase
MDEQVMKQHIDLYVNRFTVDLGREGEQAVRLLFKKAQELKLIPSIMEPLMR